MCAETTPQRLESAWIPLLTAALANQQGVEKDAERYRWLRDNCFINQNDDRDFPMPSSWCSGLMESTSAACTQDIILA